MAEYVSRDDVRRFIADAFSENRFATNYDYAILVDKIDEIPAADVQPVDRWISVDEALPIYDGLVLAVDKNNTIRLGIYTDLGWTSQFGNPMVAHITHWMPLPEPPKDGDTNG